MALSPPLLPAVHTHTHTHIKIHEPINIEMNINTLVVVIYTSSAPGGARVLGT